MRRLLDAPWFSMKELGFSPVAGIQWVETLPSGLLCASMHGFSPVAGIQWVETCSHFNRFAIVRFSPVAGIQWVETASRIASARTEGSFQSRCRDSVG